MLKELLQKFLPVGPSAKSATMGDALISVFGDQVPNFNVESAIAAYTGNVWVGAAVITRANVFGTVNFYLETKDGKRIDNHPALSLLRNPHPNITTFDLMRRVSMDEDLTGNAYWKYDLDGRGIPTRIQPLMPQHVSIIPSPDTFIKEYQYMLNGQRMTFEKDEVTHFSIISPLSLLKGQSPIFSAASAINTETESNNWNQNFFKNDARTGTILETDQDLADETKEKLKRKFDAIHKGSRKAFKTIILTGGLKIRDEGGAIQKDMEFTKLQEMNRDKVLAAFQVPKILIAQFEGGSLAEAKAAENIFAKHIITPKLTSFVQMLTLDFLPMFGADKGLKLKFDPIVESDKEYELKKNDAGLNLWMTVNERRALEGYDKITGGDELYVGISQVPVDQPELPEEDTTQEEAKSVKETMRARLEKQMTPEFKATYSEKFILRHEKLEKRFINKLQKSFADQKKEVLAALRANKAYRTTKSLADDIFNEKEEVAKFVAAFTPLVREMVKQGGEETNAIFGLGVDNLTELASFTRAVNATTLKFAREVNETTKRQIRAELAEGLAEGEGVDDLSARMSGIFKQASTSRTQTIARTETTKASNVGALITYDESGVVEEKEWLTTLDGREREDHGEANGQRQKISEPFVVGGEELRYPGDSAASAAQVCNCRCTVLPVIS